MKLVIATPLYPPDVAGAAPYVKELARRLASSHHVTVLAYGSYPEQVDGVSIIAINKHRPILPRLIDFYFALAKVAKSADAIIVENGASSELPAALAALFSNRPFILHNGDNEACERMAHRRVLRSINAFLRLFVRSVIDDRPLPRPELLPYAPAPSFTAYEESWTKHLALLHNALYA